MDHPCVPDEELLRRAVKGARSDIPRRRPRWAVVKEALAVGSVMARQLCVRFGLNPWEEVIR